MRWNQKYDRDKMFSLVEEYLSGVIMQKDLCEREGLKKELLNIGSVNIEKSQRGIVQKRLQRKRK